MSRVTNIVLLMPIGAYEEQGPVVALGLTKLDDEIRGGKHFEAEIWAGAYNYLDWDAFVTALQAVNWLDPQEIQLLVQRQEETRFTLWKIDPYNGHFRPNGTILRSEVTMTLRAITEEEKSVLDLLGEAWNQFLKLPVIHPQDQHEFMHAIHHAQNIILSRPTLDNMRAAEAPPVFHFFGCSHCGMLYNGEAHKPGCCLEGIPMNGPHNHPA